MSYARSPRPDCSITIGMRPRPLGSSMSSSTSCRMNPAIWLALLGPHQIIEVGGRFFHLHLPHRPFYDVVLHHERLDFRQSGRVAVVPPDQLVRLLEALRVGLDRLADLLGLRVEVIAAHELGHED